MSTHTDSSALRAQAEAELLESGIRISDLRLIDAETIERMRATRAQIRNEERERKLAARQLLARRLRDLKGVVQDQPHNALALFEGLVPLLFGEVLGPEGDIIVDADHE